MLNRDNFDQAAEPKTKEVPIPEWGDSVRIRQLSAQELAVEIERGKARAQSGEDENTGMAHSAVASVIDETGAPVFTEADIPKIIKYSAAGLLRLSEAINDFNGLTRKNTEKN